MNGQKRQIIKDFRYIASQKRKLKLITNFRGVQVSLPAGVIRCSQTSGMVRLRVHHRQMIHLEGVDKILVQSDLFRSKLIGDIDHIDPRKAIVTLHSLRYVTGSMGNRNNLRVQPESPIHVEILMGHGYRVQSEMVDISPDGLSLKMAKDDFPEDNLFMLQIPVEIRIGLPVSGRSAIYDSCAQGMIAYTSERQQTYRVGLLTFFKEPDLGIVRRYIFDRQTEILNEIHQMSSTVTEAA